MTGGEQEPGRPLDIQWSDQAKDDLATIGDYVATDNPAAAMRWVERLIADVERAADRLGRRADRGRLLTVRLADLELDRPQGQGPNRRAWATMPRAALGLAATAWSASARAARPGGA